MPRTHGRREGAAPADIRALLGGRIEARDIDRALAELRARGLARDTHIPTGGRPEERWFAMQPREGVAKGGGVEQSPAPDPSLHQDPVSSTTPTLSEDELVTRLKTGFGATEAAA